MLKKTLSILLSALMLISVFAIVPATASAMEPEKEKPVSETLSGGETGDCTWCLDSDELYIEGEGSMADYNDDNPAPWSEFSGGITKIIIGEDVENVGMQAFCGMENVTEATIGDSVETIGEYAFEGCSGLTGIDFPVSLKKIKSFAFKGCSKLEDISFNDGLTDIGSGAFAFCDSLTSVTIPASVTTIGEMALGFGEEAVPDFTISGYYDTAAETYADDNDFTFIPLSEESSSGVYYVAGDEALCGSDWVENDENNEMEADSSLYVKEYTGVQPGTYSIKITDGTWDNSWGNSNTGGNFIFTVTASTKICIYFDPDNKEISIEGKNVEVQKTIEVKSVTLVGDEDLCGTGWNPTIASNQMTSKDGKIFTLTLNNIAIGKYEYKFSANGNMANTWGGPIDEDDETVTYNGYNLLLKVKKDSNVSFTFDISDMDEETGKGAKCSVKFSEPSEEPSTEEPIIKPEESEPETVNIETNPDNTGENTTPSSVAVEAAEGSTAAPVPADPKIYVGGVEITDANASSITGEGITGKVSFDADTNTLTLENAKITAGHIDPPENEDSYPFLGGIFSEKPLKINLIGENTIDVSDAVPDDNKNYNLYGVVVKGALTVTGSGKLVTDGMAGNSLKIEKDADVTSSVTVGVRIRLRNAVFFESIIVEGKLSASCVTVFLDYPAIAVKNFTVAESGEVTAYASNLIPSTPSPYAAKAICITDNGTMTIYGNVTATGEGTTAGDSSSSQRNNGYGIFGQNGSAEVVLGNTGNLTISGKASAVRNITFSLTPELFIIKAGSTEESAEEVSLSGLNSQDYISFKTTYVPPTEAETINQETAPAGTEAFVTVPGGSDNPTAPAGTEASATTPGESDNPTAPAGTEAPATAPGGFDNPTTPVGTDTIETAPAGSDAETVPDNTAAPALKKLSFNYLPDKDQYDKGYRYVLALQDNQGNIHLIDFKQGKVKLNGIPVYSAEAEIDYEVVSIMYQIYSGDTWIGQIAKSSDDLEALSSGVITSDGSVYGEQKDEEKTPEKKTTTTKKKANPIKVSVKTKTLKISKLKKLKQTAKPLTIKKAQGTVKVTIKSIKPKDNNKKNISVSSKGKFTFKKGTYKKTTYKIKVQIQAAGNKNYKKKTINKVVKIIIA